MKSLKVIFAVALIFFCLNLAYAQAVEPIKTDDVLKWRGVRLNSVGQSITDGPSTPFSSTVKIDPTTSDRSYSSKEVVVLRMNKLFATLQKDSRTLKAEESFSLLPQNLTLGKFCITPLIVCSV